MIDVSSIYRRQRQGLRQGAALAVMLSLTLAGCDRPLNGAIDLFHDLEGGPIADQRPPPPGVDDPYPNLGTTPARPLAADAVAQQRIEDSLAAQRDAATAAAAADPLKALPPTPPPPPKPPADDPNANKVVVDAAPSPPPPPQPAAQPAPAPPPSSGLGSVPALAAPVASGPVPELAAAPPPGPVGFGNAPPPPPPTPQIVVPPPAASPVGIVVAFTPGSTTLPPSANLRLRRYVMAHHGAQFTVTGRGDGGWRSPEAQSRAMELALKRAAAIAVSLSGSGVAPGNIHIHADAVGTESIATLN